jgi:molybdate transport system substrate-binding protein
MTMGRAAASLAAALWCSGAGCGGPAAAEQRVSVFAAASLTAPFATLAAEFERLHAGIDVELHFAGTPQLVVQMREGAAADVFAAADAANMQRVVDSGQTASPPRLFAHNRLCIVISKGNPNGIRGLADLARADLRVLLCGPEVPAGRYARQALANASVVVKPVSDEPSVKAVVSKVRLGEADAGIVYVTDTKGMAGIESVAIPENHNVTASYPIAVLSTGHGRAGGEAFVAFVLSAEGQRLLRAAGFECP